MFHHLLVLNRTPSPLTEWTNVLKLETSILHTSYRTQTARVLWMWVRWVEPNYMYYQSSPETTGSILMTILLDSPVTGGRAVVIIPQRVLWTGIHTRWERDLFAINTGFDWWLCRVNARKVYQYERFEMVNSRTIWRVYDPSYGWIIFSYSARWDRYYFSVLYFGESKVEHWFTKFNDR